MRKLSVLVLATSVLLLLSISIVYAKTIILKVVTVDESGNKLINVPVWIDGIVYKTNINGTVNVTVNPGIHIVWVHPYPRNVMEIVHTPLGDYEYVVNASFVKYVNDSWQYPDIMMNITSNITLVAVYKILSTVVRKIPNIKIVQPRIRLWVLKQRWTTIVLEPDLHSLELRGACEKISGPENGTVWYCCAYQADVYIVSPNGKLFNVTVYEENRYVGNVSHVSLIFNKCTQGTYPQLPTWILYVPTYVRHGILLYSTEENKYVIKLTDYENNITIRYVVHGVDPYFFKYLYITNSCSYKPRNYWYRYFYIVNTSTIFRCTAVPVKVNTTPIYFLNVSGHIIVPYRSPSHWLVCPIGKANFTQIEKSSKIFYSIGHEYRTVMVDPRFYGNYYRISVLDYARDGIHDMSICWKSTSSSSWTCESVKLSNVTWLIVTVDHYYDPHLEVCGLYVMMFNASSGEMVYRKNIQSTVCGLDLLIKDSVGVIYGGFGKDIDSDVVGVNYRFKYLSDWYPVGASLPTCRISVLKIKHLWAILGIEIVNSSNMPVREPVNITVVSTGYVYKISGSSTFAVGLLRTNQTLYILGTVLGLPILNVSYKISDKSWFSIVRAVANVFQVRDYSGHVKVVNVPPSVNYRVFERWNYAIMSILLRGSGVQCIVVYYGHRPDKVDVIVNSSYIYDWHGSYLRVCTLLEHDTNITIVDKYRVRLVLVDTKGNVINASTVLVHAGRTTIEVPMNVDGFVFKRWLNFTSYINKVTLYITGPVTLVAVYKIPTRFVVSAILTSYNKTYSLVKVSGRLVDAYGDPVRNADIYITLVTSRGNFTRVVETDRDGLFNVGFLVERNVTVRLVVLRYGGSDIYVGTEIAVRPVRPILSMGSILFLTLVVVAIIIVVLYSIIQRRRVQSRFRQGS